MIKLLLGVEPEYFEDGDENQLVNRSRRWSTLQSREFGGLHAALAYLILSCDTAPHRSCGKYCKAQTRSSIQMSRSFSKFSIFSGSAHFVHTQLIYIYIDHFAEKHSLEADIDSSSSSCSSQFVEPSHRVFPKSAAVNNRYLDMPEGVLNLLYKSEGLCYLFIREAVSACREVSGTCEFGVKLIVDMLIQVAYCSAHFSQFLIEELMKQYNQVNSGELKNLSTLMLEILVSKNQALYNVGGGGRGAQDYAEIFPLCV